MLREACCYCNGLLMKACVVSSNIKAELFTETIPAGV